MDDVKYFPYGEKELAYLRKKDKKLSAVIDRVGRHTSMLVQPVGLSMMRMPSGIDHASFASGIRRVCAVQAFRRKAEPCRRRNSLPPRKFDLCEGPP